MLKSYYLLAKPGIVYGNLFTAIAGYLMASKLHLEWHLLFGMIVGYALVIASACAFNNLYDRDIDILMDRTKERPSVSGDVSLKAGIVFAIITALIGFSVLLIEVNLLSFSIAALGFIVYVSFYTYFKRKTHYSTLIGSFSGATPIVGGYVAYSSSLTTSALIIGLMMLVWQMPHFYAIAIFREKDYRRAKIPVLPIVVGKKITSYFMIFYSLLYLALVVALYFNSSLGLSYLIIMGLVALAWLVINLEGLKAKEINSWAKKSFITSLGVVLVMSLVISFA